MLYEMGWVGSAKTAKRLKRMSQAFNCDSEAECRGSKAPEQDVGFALRRRYHLGARGAGRNGECYSTSKAR